jgi:NAD(P)-dependent dehydrogenase (short-subunit alcohol dehydrogenase family)
MSSVFTGKRIVVTGGAGGIGIETVRGFMEQRLAAYAWGRSRRLWIRRRNVLG